MLNFKNFVLNGLAGPYRKFLGMAMKKFGNFTRPTRDPRTKLRDPGTKSGDSGPDLEIKGSNLGTHGPYLGTQDHT